MKKKNIEEKNEKNEKNNDISIDTSDNISF
jgi:hypothetical protein